MSAKDDAIWKIETPVVTLRQFYKAAALTGLLAADANDQFPSLEAAVKIAGQYADCMIAEDEEAAKP